MNKPIRFAFHGETKGALRYGEVDAEGRELEQTAAQVGSLYFRKARFGEISAEWASTGTPPRRLTVTIEET